MAFLPLSAASLLPLILSFFLAQMSTVSGTDFFNLDDKTGAVWLHSSSNITMEERIEMALSRNLNALSDPDEVMSMLDMRLKKSISKRRKLGYSSQVMPNPVDDCWRHDPDWSHNRMALADCGIGFGRHAFGGKNGRFYLVTDPNDYDPVSPRPGTIRHAVIQTHPLWIVFKKSMVIQLKQELIFNSFKTIDGRGVNVEIAYGGCITLQFVTNIIIHGISIHNCVPTGNAMVRSSPSHYGYRTMADGDAISIFTSSNIWIDHVTLAHCYDGLIDAVMGSTAITITNNYFTDHNEVMLMGHSDYYNKDIAMQATIAYNHFGENLNQRMPRCRFGNFQVVNNYYEHWHMYALGGSAQPTINSQGNQYVAQNHAFTKEVTKRLNSNGDGMNWNWTSRGDLLLNGASFLESGQKFSGYSRASTMVPKSANLVPLLVHSAGSLRYRTE